MTAPPVTLRSPAELLVVIPHLLGFEPDRAIVVVALRDKKIGLTQRMDLPDPDRVEEVADALVRHVLKDSAQAVLLVGYEATAGESHALVAALTERLREGRVSVRDRIVVHERRWRSLDCHNPACCPPDGRPLPAPDEAASAVAEFIGRGSAPLPDRNALAGQVEAGSTASEVADLMGGEGVPHVTLTEEEARHRLAGVWARVLEVDGDPITVADAAVALQSLTDVATHDGLAALLTNTLARQELPHETRALLSDITQALQAHEDVVTDSVVGGVKARLITLCRHASDEHAAPSLTLLATYSWWHGDGALARVALDRALRCDPTYRLARLLVLMLDEGIRPEHP